MRAHAIWSERWKSLEQRLEALEDALRAQGAVVRRGGDYDRWDLSVRGGLFGTVRARATVEEHGGGKQLVRICSWPRVGPRAFALLLLFSFLAALAAVDGAWIVAAVLLLTAGTVAVSAFADCAAATASFLYALGEGRIESGQFVRESDAPRARWRVREKEGTQPASTRAIGVLEVAE
jgi:hypothetical protein